MRLTQAIIVLSTGAVVDQALHAEPNLLFLWLAVAILAFAFAHLADLIAADERPDLGWELHELAIFDEWAWPKRPEGKP